MLTLRAALLLETRQLVWFIILFHLSERASKILKETWHGLSSSAFESMTKPFFLSINKRVGEGSLVLTRKATSEAFLEKFVSDGVGWSVRGKVGLAKTSSASAMNN